MCDKVYKARKKTKANILHTMFIQAYHIIIYERKKTNEKKRNFMVLSIQKHTYVKNNIFYRSRIRFSLFQGEKNTL